MDKDVVIKVEGLYKKFTRSLKRSLFYGSIDVTRSMLGIEYDTKVLRKSEFWSLENVNFELKRGETFGLVGANGSGKSTLLRMVNGIFPPDGGKIEVRGRIGALIAVGAGFHPHMTGRENILLNATILGMTHAEVEKEMDNIINFAEIGDFLDAPVSTYSSGMTVRLGFAIAIHCYPDIMLVDEILAVGDAKFQRKCLDKIKEMRGQGTTFILVSHNMQNIEGFCERVLLLDHGKQLALGPAREVIPEYELLLQDSSYIVSSAKAESQGLAESGLPLIYKPSGYGTDEVSVRSLKLLNADGHIIDSIESDKPACFDVEIESTVDVDKAWLLFRTYFTPTDYKDTDATAVSGVRQQVSLKKGRHALRLKLPRLGLATGKYWVSFQLLDDTSTNPYIQGDYGYFTVRNSVPTALKLGSLGQPYYWYDNEFSETSLPDSSN